MVLAGLVVPESNGDTLNLEDINKIIMFDTETVGLKPNYIISLGYRYFERGKKPIFGEIRCNPDYFIPEAATKVNGFTNEMVKDWPLFVDKWYEIEPLFRDSLWLGHNLKFDSSAVMLEASRYGFKIPHHYDIDTLEIAKKMIPKGTTANYKLGTLCEYFDIKAEEENYHSADFDIWATDKLFRKLLAYNKQKGEAFNYLFKPKEVDGDYTGVLPEETPVKVEVEEDFEF